MRKSLFLLTALLFFSNYLFAQNSMVGDGFGGRGWYKPHNYQVGAYSAYTVCGSDSQLYAWGYNGQGELGNGTNISTTTPIAVNGMTGVKFYSTGYISAAIKTDNTTWVWGVNSILPTTFGYIPVQVLADVKFVDAGINHVVFVKNDGTVWGAGTNFNGELGNGTTSFTPLSVPVQMSGINNAVRAIAVSMAYTSCTIILLADSTVKITGGGGLFQSVNSTVPVTLPDLSNIIDIKGGNFATYALNSIGEVFSFGRDGNGNIPVLGLGITSGNLVPPTRLSFPQGAAPIVGLSANNDGYSCLALDSNHNVYGWGYNRDGQLGDGTNVNISVPKLIATDVIDIFAGETFSYILKSDNSLWAAGRSLDGSIWMNLPNIQRNVFTQIDPTIPPLNLCAPKVWGVVPIKLSNFTCVANGNSAYLNWQSAEETNADKYIVEYSSDGRNFQGIATVIAKGSNSKYSFIHQQVSGTAFYRLKMIDKDGRFTYSEIRSIKFNLKNGFTIAPNPANGVIHLYTKSSDEIKSVQVFSAEGKLLQSISSYQNNEGVNIDKLSKGAYVVRVVFRKEAVEYGRFVKM